MNKVILFKKESRIYLRVEHDDNSITENHFTTMFMANKYFLDTIKSLCLKKNNILIQNDVM